MQEACDIMEELKKPRNRLCRVGEASRMCNVRIMRPPSTDIKTVDTLPSRK